jgi:hypothetical protein
MDEYQIVFAGSARKELEALPEATALRVLARIETLALRCRLAQSDNFV